MARLEYLDDENRPALTELISTIKGARSDRLINLYKLLLHSPPIAEGWLALGGALRNETELDGLIRELAITRVALLTSSDYEFAAHERYARNEGATPKQVEELGDWAKSDLFDVRQRAALAYADAMTEDVRVEDSVFEALRSHFDDRAILELTVNIAFYNMVARVLEAMKIDPETALPVLDQEA